MATDKRTAYRQRMAERGLIQVSDWVPRDQKAIYKAVAKALRNGANVAIGEVPRDQPDETQPIEQPDRATNGAESVPRDQEREIPKTVDELLARRAKLEAERKAKPKTRRRRVPTDLPSPHQERQARYAAQWSEATESVRVIDPNGEEREGRVLERQQKQTAGLLGDIFRFQAARGLILKGKTYQTLAFEIWPNHGIKVTKPAGWRLVSDGEIAAARKRVQDLHPDKGGPGGDEFKTAKVLLDALLGRASQ